jgi:hypothetical protein
MKRFLGIMVGLSLGWLAAGYAFAQHAPEVAEGMHHEQAAEHATAVSQLTEGAVAGAPWLPLVLIIAAGLFGAGIFVNLMGWAKPQPVEAETHDDHGHDAHHH